MKIAMIYHSIDCDGYMSAAIVKYWFEKNNAKFIEGDVISLGNKDSIQFIGYNNGDKEPDLSKYDKVIMCDISFSKENMWALYLKLRNNFIWIDHHISKMNDIKQYSDIPFEGIRDINFAACELTWQYFFPKQPMPEIVRLLGRYDCFGSIGTDEEQKVFEFQYGARAIINNYNDAYKSLTKAIECPIGYTNMIWEKGQPIYEYLKKEANTLYRSGFPITFNVWTKNPNILKNEIMIPAEDGIGYHSTYKFICINRGSFNPANFKIDYHSDGYQGVAIFHYSTGKWRFSLYNEDGTVDCSYVAKSYGGGGHKKAAGMVLTNEQLIELLDNK